MAVLKRHRYYDTLLLIHELISKHQKACKALDRKSVQIELKTVVQTIIFDNWIFFFFWSYGMNHVVCRKFLFK